MKKLTNLLALLGIATTLCAADKNIKVKVTNPSLKARSAVPVVIKVDDSTVKAIVKRGDYELPSQLDDLNDDGLNDEVSFLTDMNAGETQEFTITLSSEGVPQSYTNRTYGYIGIRDRREKKPQHQRVNSITFPKSTNPYNYVYPHGAVMENDMVGFRVYCDHRQSIDFYGHRHRKMDIAETGFYTTPLQREQGYGEDVLYTGSTYGCGALHGWDGKNAIMFENVRNTTQTIVCEGPIRTIVDIINKGWQPTPDCRPLDIVTRYILYYGHRDVEVQVKFSRPVPDLQLSTGIVDIVEGSEEYSDKAGLRGDWGRACAGNNPKAYDTITVGLGIYVPSAYYKSDSHFTDGKQRLPNQAYVQVVGTKTDNLHYWFASTAHIESFGFSNKDAWFKWLEDWKKELEEPVKIK